jgi:hypothetical protein
VRENRKSATHFFGGAEAGPYGGRENSGKWEEIGFFDDFSFPLFVLPYRWQREGAVKIALGWISLGFC